MAIPDYQTIMLPLLLYASDNKSHSLKEAILHVSDQFSLSSDERDLLLPSGTQAIINNRVGWARTYLKKAGLIEDPKRGYLKITQRGLDFLSRNPSELNVKILEQFDEFIDFRKRRNTKDNDVLKEENSSFNTPQEALEYGIANINSTLIDDLLDSIMACSPGFFEKLVVELLVKMGYGGSRHEAGKVLGKSGDEGIDGIIKEDKLGLDTIYIQAKRWTGVVGRPEIQKFVGALAGQRARKGIFITTSRFSAEAEDYVSNIESKIVLIDGPSLADLMIDSNLGVSTVNTIEIKRIDTDYFIEE